MKRSAWIAAALAFAFAAPLLAADAGRATKAKPDGQAVEVTPEMTGAARLVSVAAGSTCWLDVALLAWKWLSPA